ncbi:MAG: CDP-alcohol phosphatidyltransferase family protein [Alphaproteobacteria bacterium]
MTLPNVITLARLMSVPLGVWLLLGGYFSGGFWVILAATLSDAVDGFLARRLNMQSRVGAVLDPIADKVLLVGIFVTLGYQDYVETWLVILIVFRDFLIVGGAIVLQLLTGDLHVRPTAMSKFNTAAQMILAVLIVGQLAFALNLTPYLTYLTWLVAGTTVVSGALYLVLWGQRVSGADQLGAGRQ